MLEDELEKKVMRNQRVKNLAKCRSQITFDQFMSEEKKINDRISNVYVMRRETAEKAGEIMGKKEDNAYMGRHILSQKNGILSMK